MSFNMYVPTRFIFGNGRLSELSQSWKERGILVYPE